MTIFGQAVAFMTDRYKGYKNTFHTMSSLDVYERQVPTTNACC